MLSSMCLVRLWCTGLADICTAETLSIMHVQAGLLNGKCNARSCHRQVLESARQDAVCLCVVDGGPVAGELPLCIDRCGDGLARSHASSVEDGVGAGTEMNRWGRCRPRTAGGRRCHCRDD
jgi:hypothetical protein